MVTKVWPREDVDGPVCRPWGPAPASTSLLPGGEGNLSLKVPEVALQIRTSGGPAPHRALLTQALFKVVLEVRIFTDPAQDHAQAPACGVN